MKRFRLFNKMYADILGYFWSPCPICKEYFGGHEWNLGGGIPIAERRGISDGICDDCERKYHTNELTNKAWSDGKTWEQIANEISEVVYSHKHN